LALGDDDDAARTPHPRDINPEHLSTNARLPWNSHVLLMDDTWTSGGHAQSAVLALRKAYAAYISVLVVARWVKEDFGDNAKFLRSLSYRDYDPDICPWTGGPAQVTQCRQMPDDLPGPGHPCGYPVA
jgi:hypothetical protein